MSRPKPYQTSRAAVSAFSEEAEQIDPNITVLHGRDDDANDDRVVLRKCNCGQDVAVTANMTTACPRCGFVFNVEANSEVAEAITVEVNEDGEIDHHNFSTGPGAAFRNGQLSGVMMGHFLLEDVLGSGGMGSVYRALDTSLQRYVAVKVINDVKYGSSQQPLTSAIVREAVAQARLNHPNVVTIYYVGRTLAEPFLAMELIEGSTLRERLNEGAIPYAVAIRLTMQLVRALEHASRINIVHGDVKPNNLLLDSNDNVKLSDFGLACSTLETTNNRPISGTPAYMAPELFSSREASIQSDMYAVGVTLFEMIFGRLPYTVTGNSARDHMNAHESATIEYPDVWPRALPIELKEVVNRLLAKSPDKRYANYTDVLEDLQRIRPVTTTVAGVALRAVAFAIDQVVLLACFIPFAIPIYLTTLEMTNYDRYGDMFRPWIWLIALFALVVPVGHFAWIRGGHRTFGRYLFQLRVTEQHGLELPRHPATIRGIMRNAPAWMLPLGLLLGMYFYVADEITYVLLLSYLLIEVIFVVTSVTRQSLHDVLCHSQVVLDSKPALRMTSDVSSLKDSDKHRFNLHANETMMES
jgi:eukaryotic-like serine/threonine-protein kinase